MEKIKRNRSSPINNSPLKCSGCKKRIRSRFYVTALEETWHERCLTCDICSEILFSFGSGKCYCRDGLKLCLMDYLRMYGKQGVCSMCSETIQSTEKVMKFKKFIYHQRCFSCSICQVNFAKGDCVAVPKEKLILCPLHHRDYTISSTRNNLTNMTSKTSTNSPGYSLPVIKEEEFFDTNTPTINSNMYTVSKVKVTSGKYEINSNNTSSMWILDGRTYIPNTTANNVCLNDDISLDFDVAVTITPLHHYTNVVNTMTPVVCGGGGGF